MNYSKTNLNDLAFEFLIPEDVSLESFNFQYKTREWDGIHYNQGLPESSFGSNFKLVRTPVPDHHLNLLLTKYKTKNWYSVLVQGPGLELFAESILSNGQEEKGYSLRDLVKKLLNFTGQWAVVFEPDYDFKLETKEGTIDDIVNGITFSISVKKHGFIYFGSSSKLS